METEYSLQTGYRLENSGTDEDTTRSVEHGPREMEEMASRVTLEYIVNLPKELNRRIPNGTYGGVRGMNNLYSIGERNEPITRVLIMPYDTESQTRNADFILIALRAIPQPSGQRPVKLKNPPAKGRSILRTFLHAP